MKRFIKCFYCDAPTEDGVCNYCDAVRDGFLLRTFDWDFHKCAVRNLSLILQNHGNVFPIWINKKECFVCYLRIKDYYYYYEACHSCSVALGSLEYQGNEKEFFKSVRSLSKIIHLLGAWNKNE